MIELNHKRLFLYKLCDDCSIQQVEYIWAANNSGRRPGWRDKKTNKLRSWPTEEYDRCKNGRVVSFDSNIENIMPLFDAYLQDKVEEAKEKYERAQMMYSQFKASNIQTNSHSCDA